MRPLSLPRVPECLARACSELGRGRWLELEYGEETVRLTLSTQGSYHSREGAPTLQLSSRHGPVYLSNADALLSLWGDMPVITTGDTQAWYWQLVNHRFAPVLQELFSPLQPSNEASLEPAELINCQLCTERAGETVWAVLKCSAETLLCLFQAAPWQFSQHRLPESWAVVRPLIVGRVSLTASELRSLHEGDVLLADDGSFDTSGYGRMLLGDRLWAVNTERQNDHLQLRLIHEEPLHHAR